MKLPPGYVKGQALAPPKKASGFGGYGQTMLEKMGWQKGQGLGKNQHGMAEALDVKRKDDALGVGASESDWKWDWKYWEDAYNGAAKSIDATTTSAASDSGGSGSSDGSGSSSSDDSSDDDEPALSQLMACVNHDGTRATGSADELKLAQQLAKDPWGRFGGKRGKLARIRQQEEAMAAAARAKLQLVEGPVVSISAAAVHAAAAKAAAGRAAAGKAGASTGGAANGVAGESDARKAAKQKRAREEQEPGPEEAAVGDTGSKKRKKAAAMAAEAADTEGSKSKQKKAKRKAADTGSSGVEEAAADGGAAAVNGSDDAGASGRRRMVIEVKVKAAPAQVAPYVPTPATGWWGAKQFASAGLLEGLDEAGEHVKKERAAFNEDDQEQLYHKAQGGKSQGKRGLGKSEKLAIAGGNWEGTKTTFQDEDEANAAAPAGTDQQQHQRQQQQRKQQQGGAEEGAEEGQEQEEGRQQGAKQRKQQNGAGHKPKWGKLAVKLLQEAPGSTLKYKKLWRALWQEQQGQQEGADEAACKARCWRKLQSCSKLEVQGKVVSLKM